MFDLIYLILIPVLSVYAWSIYNLPILVAGVKHLRRNRKKLAKVPSEEKESSDLPSFSIIVPVKNEEKVIGRLLDALDKLDYPAEKKEIITVEVKDEPIKLRHIAQAKFYQDIFNATFGLLISSKGIPEETVRLVLHTTRGKVIRGKVIIAQSIEHQIHQYSAQFGHFTSLRINPKFRESVPEPFKDLCKPQSSV